MGSGWSRPYWCSSCDTDWPEAWMPSAMRMGSPGARCTRKNVIRVTPMMTKIMLARRLMTNAPRPIDPLQITYMSVYVVDYVRAQERTRGRMRYATTATWQELDHE